MLLTASVVNNTKHCAPDWPDSSSADTKDKVFLLSYGEVYKTYLKDQKTTQICEATPYAIAQGVQVLDTNTNACFWWTRTMGNHRYMRIIVMDDGSYDTMDMDTTSIGVRPVIWVNRKAIENQLSLTNKK